MTYREFFEQMTVKNFFDRSLQKNNPNYKVKYDDAFEDFICFNLDCCYCPGKYHCGKAEWLDKEREINVQSN